MAASTGPYKGLDYFREEDAHLFYGRDADRTRIIGNLGVARLTLLYAESGVGKSSLLRAGVAAPLRAAESKLYLPVVVNRWDGDRRERLVRALRGAVQGFFGDRPHEPISDGNLMVALREAAQRTGALPLVILDQFEDHLLFPHSDTETFDRELAACVNERNLPANFLISIRQDAYSEIGNRFDEHIPNVYANYLHLDFLDDAAAREAAVKPLLTYHARNGGAEIKLEQELLDTLLGQLRSLRSGLEEGARASAGTPTPAHLETGFLQLVLARIWSDPRTQESKLMQRRTLVELGGAKQIIQSYLDGHMEALPRKERDWMAGAFRGLVTSTGRKIALTATELTEYASKATPQQLEPTLAALEERNILRAVPSPGEERHEIFHDVLATAILDWRRRWVEKRVHQRANLRLALIAAGIVILAAIGLWGLHKTGEVRQATGRVRALTFESLAASQLTTRPDLAAQFAYDAYAASPGPETTSQVLATFPVLATTATRAVLTGPTDYVSAVVYSTDGSIVAAGGGDRSVYVWSVRTRRLLAVLKDGMPAVRDLAASRDGHTLAVSSGEDKVRLWDLRHLDRGPRVLREKAPVVALAFSGDGKTLAGGVFNGVELLDVASGKPTRSLKGFKGPVRGVAFSPDGREIAAVSADKTTRTFDRASGHLLQRYDFARPVNALAYSHDGRTLAVADDQTSIWLLDLRHYKASGEPFDGANETQRLAFSPDGRLLAAATWRSVRTYDIRKRAIAGIDLTGQTGWVNDVAWSPDSRFLASASSDKTVRLYDVRDGERRGVLIARSPVEVVAYSPRDNSVVASGSDDGRVRLWNYGQRRQIGASMRAGRQQAHALAFDGKGDLLATGAADGAIRLWDVATQRQVGPTLNVGGSAVRAVAFDPRGGLLASGGKDGVVRLWDLRSYKAHGRPFGDRKGWVDTVAFSPDGTQLASAGGDHVIQRWDVDTGKAVGAPMAGHRAPISSVAYSPDGRMLASGSEDRTILVWHADTGKVAGPPLTGHSGEVYSVAWMPDSRTLVSASADESLRLWDVQSAQQLGPDLRGPNAAIVSVAVSRDGTRIVSGSVDQTVSVSRGIFWRDATDLRHRLCSLIAPGITAREWQQRVRDDNIPYQPTCTG